MTKKRSSNYGFRSKSEKKFKSSSKQRTKAALSELNVRPSKERGQNFLVNDLVINSIIEFGAPSADEYIVEIGPGLGALTKALVPYGLKAVIEIEEAFAEQVRKTYPNIEVFQTDARTFDFSDFGKPVTIFANLPYSISSEMILALCEAGGATVKRVVLMLQKEFAQRLCAEVGAKDYGILSVFCQRAAYTNLGPIVGAEYFHPQPKIDSQILEFTFRQESTKPASDEHNQFFRKVVRASFAKRRKKILNSLVSSSIDTEERITQALNNAGINPGCRAQELTYLDFERLATALAEP